MYRQIVGIQRPVWLAWSSVVFLIFAAGVAIFCVQRSGEVNAAMPWFASALLIATSVFAATYVGRYRQAKVQSQFVGPIAAAAFGGYAAFAALSGLAAERSGWGDECFSGLIAVYAVVNALCCLRAPICIVAFLSAQLAIVSIAVAGGRNTLEFGQAMLVGQALVAVMLSGALSLLLVRSKKLERILDRCRLGRNSARVSVKQIRHAKDQFLRSACHDLRQPAQALKLLAEELNLRPDSRRYEILLGQVKAASANLDELLTALAAISEIDMIGSMREDESIDLFVLLNNACTALTPLAKSKQLRLSVSPTDCRAQVNRAAITAIVNNLISNAIKYTDRGWIQVYCLRRNDKIDVVVHDTGRGIPEKDQPHIFEEFFRGSNIGPRDMGSGLGLALVRRLVDKAGLELKMTTVESFGTRFILTVDSSPLFPSSGVPMADNLRFMAGMNVLLLEDDRVISSTIRRTLESWGAEVIESHNVREAVHSYYSAHVRPNLLVLDYRLEGGGSGFDALVTLKESLRVHDTPILVTTGDLGVTIDPALSMLKIKIAHKPISTARLQQELQALLSGRRFEQPFKMRAARRRS